MAGHRLNGGLRGWFEPVPRGEMIGNRDGVCAANDGHIEVPEIFAIDYHAIVLRG